MARVLARFAAHVRRQWFLYGVAVAIAGAWWWPDGMRSGGLLHAEAWWQALMVLIFVCSGAGLPSDELRSAFGRWRLHLAVQVFSLVAIPLLCWAASPLLVRILGRELADGCLLLACQPTTIAGCIALTRAAGGDVAAALFNAVAGSLLGVVVTPLSSLLLTGIALHVPLASVFGQLLLLALVPFAVGQGLRRLLAARIDCVAPWLTQLTMLCLLGVIWHVFSDSVHQGIPAVPLSALPLVLAVVVGGHAVVLALAWSLGGWGILRLSRPGRVALTVIAAQKTAGLGIPMLTLMFAGDPRLGLYTLPLLIWHPTQMVVASVIAGRLAGWAAGSGSAAGRPS